MANISYVELFTKVRVNFLFNHPFLSVLALSIPIIYGKNRKSALTTNGAKITIDLDKLAKYSEENITYLYAHTLLHIVLKHPFRRDTRDSYLWNMAADLVVNGMLHTFENIGIKPDDEIVDLDLADKCVEEVYFILSQKKDKEEKENSQNSDTKENEAKASPKQNGDKKAFVYDESKLDLEEIADEKSSQGACEKLDGIIIQALTIAQKTIHKYGGLKIEIETLLKPKISLHDILKEYLITSFFEKTTTFERPNKRYIHTGLYLPGVKKCDELLEVYIALDSSSSVGLLEYKKFLGIIQDVCEGFYEYKVTILPFDISIKEEYIVTFDNFHPLKESDLLIPKSDGGTNFDVVQEYLQNSEIRGETLLIVLSDGWFEINLPLISKTLFIISDKKNLPKFESYGRVIQFNL